MRHNNHILPPEWSESSHVLLSWPHDHTDWAYMLEEVRECFKSIVTAISQFARVIIVAPNPSEVKDFFSGCHLPITLVETPTNDTWARDFGMICTRVPDGTIMVNDFKFNGWGLKYPAYHDNLVTRKIVRDGLLSATSEYVNRLGFVLEGGSIDVNEEGTLITTSNCLLSPNRNGDLTKSQIEERLKTYLGCRRVLWVDHGNLEGDDTDSHIDTLARFLPGGYIACSACDRPEDSHYRTLKAMIDQISNFKSETGSRYKIIELPIPMPIFDEEGLRLPATYANFLIINNALIMPVYNDYHYDNLAIERIKAILPEYQVICVDCRALIRQHGSLHCMTMQIPENTLSIH